MNPIIYKAIGGTAAILVCLWFASLWMAKGVCYYTGKALDGASKATDKLIDGVVDMMLESEK